MGYYKTLSMNLVSHTYTQRFPSASKIFPQFTLKHKIEMQQSHNNATNLNNNKATHEFTGKPIPNLYIKTHKYKGTYQNLLKCCRSHT